MNLARFIVLSPKLSPLCSYGIAEQKFSVFVRTLRKLTANSAKAARFCEYAQLRTKFLLAAFPVLSVIRKEFDPPSMLEKDEHLISLGLTRREAEVLGWIARGKSNHDISVILGASPRTVCKHVEHIFCKLNVENRTAAAIIACAVLNQIADFL